MKKWDLEESIYIVAEKEEIDVISNPNSYYPSEFEIKQSKFFNVDTMVVEIMMYHCSDALV